MRRQSQDRSEQAGGPASAKDRRASSALPRVGRRRRRNGNYRRMLGRLSGDCDIDPGLAGAGDIYLPGLSGGREELPGTGRGRAGADAKPSAPSRASCPGTPVYTGRMGGGTLSQFPKPRAIPLVELVARVGGPPPSPPLNTSQHARSFATMISPPAPRVLPLPRNAGSRGPGRGSWPDP